MKSLLFLLFLISTTQTFSGTERGNGGSLLESSLLTREIELKSIGQKIQIFFSVNQNTLQDVFPEFNVQDLITIISNADIKIKNEKLYDKNNELKTCLNFQISKKIECNLEMLNTYNKIDDQPELFMLMMHEYLGLLNVNDKKDQDNRFSVSRRLLKYVYKIQSYDLLLTDPNKVNNKFENFIRIQYDVTITDVSCGNYLDQSNHHGHDYFVLGAVKFKNDRSENEFEALIFGERLAEDSDNLTIYKGCKYLKKLIGQKIHSMTLEISNFDTDISNSEFRVKEFQKNKNEKPKSLEFFYN